MAIKALESPVQVVTVSPSTAAMPIEYPGPQKVLPGTFTSTPGTPQTAIAASTPSSGSWRVRKFEITSRAYAVWSLKKGATVIKTGVTSPAQSFISVPLEPWVEITTDDDVSVSYDQAEGPAVTVYARVIYTEH